jgi:ABC-type lipoprotein export system ATPase subunit
VTPLLVLDGARIESGGIAGEPLTCSGGANRLTLVGNFRPLFRLLSGEARLDAGRAELAGIPAAGAVRTGALGLALLDPPLVPDFSVERYLLESARLAGLAEADAKAAVEAALAYFELGGLRRLKPKTLFAPARRVLLLAHATLAAPEILCAEAPLADLDAEGQAYVALALEKAAAGRRLMVSVPTSVPAGAERAMLERADFIIEEHAGRIVREGPRLERATKRYFATVTRSGAGFLAALGARGVSARATPFEPVRLGENSLESDGPLRVIIELSLLTSTTDVVLAAHAAGAPLVELGPA